MDIMIIGAHDILNPFHRVKKIVGNEAYSFAAIRSRILRVCLTSGLVGVNICSSDPID